MGDDDEGRTPASDDEPVPSGAAQYFGTNLRAVRERKGMTQAQFADEMTKLGASGWRQQTVTRVENGLRRVWLDEAQMAAGILGVTMDRLMWAPAEEAEAGYVATVAATLRESAEQVRLTVARLLAARHAGEAQAAERRGSRHERVRDAVHDLENDLESATLDAAVAAGMALWERERDG